MAKGAPVASLPNEPSFEQLRNQAKDLRRAVLAGEADALAEAAERVGDVPGPFPLHTAQLVVARRYGFPSWTRLKRHVEVIERYSRFPDRMPDAGPASLADEFLRLVSLYYADDEPERWAAGRRLLASHPEITQDSVPAAASDQPWQTALHKAAEDGHLELARTLLRLGADPDLRDHRFDSTPLGWARYFGQQPLIDLLEPLTAPQDGSQPTTPTAMD
jgi:ankyrin repeat protein